MSDYDWPKLEAWAHNILVRAKGNWVIPDTFSMRMALDQLWVKNAHIEKTWIEGRNAFRLTT